MYKFRRTAITLTIVLTMTQSLVVQAYAAKSDYNHDGSSDILFQHSDDGRLLLWNMTNFTRSLHFPKSLAMAWSVKGKGDFNGDGTSDVLYMKDAGDTAIALMNNSARSNLTFPGGINPVWSVKGVGDFDGDGTDDILWQRSTDGVTTIWGIKNAARNKISYPGALASFWRIAGIGDFNNDGTDDILCQHNDDGRLLIWQMNNLARTSVKFAQSIANSWAVVGVGDFNNNGTDDVLYRKDAGDVAIAEMSDFNRSNLKFPGGVGTVWGVKDVGDYNGDGTDDILFRRSTDGVTLIWGISNSARVSINWPGGLVAQWIVQVERGEQVDSFEGLYDGTTNTGRSWSGLILDDGTYYALYSRIGEPNILGGVVQGNSTAKGGEISSINLRDFSIEGAGVLPATMLGTYTTKKMISGVTSYENNDNVSFSGTYNPDYELTPTLGTVAGNYSGEVAFTLGYENADITIYSNGSLSGIGTSGCTLTGAVVPRNSGNVYNVSATFGGAPCYFTYQTMTGIAYYNSSDNLLYIAAPNASRTEGLLFVGSKR